MSKGIAFKDGLKIWCERTGKNPSEEKIVKLHGWVPSIGKLDASVAQLTNCEQLSLSTNVIDKLTNLNSLTKLKILSVGRNNLKSFNGIEGLAGTLEQLWASYNVIDKLKPLACLKNLKVFYFSNNTLKDSNELKHLAELPCLDDVVMKNCPLEINLMQTQSYRQKVQEMLPQVNKLDGTLLSTGPAKEEDEENI